MLYVHHAHHRFKKSLRTIQPVSRPPAFKPCSEEPLKGPEEHGEPIGINAILKAETDSKYTDTVLLWEKVKQHNLVSIVNMGIPAPFRPQVRQGLTTRPVRDQGDRSTSASSRPREEARELRARGVHALHGLSDMNLIRRIQQPVLPPQHAREGEVHPHPGPPGDRDLRRPRESLPSSPLDQPARQGALPQDR